MKLHTVALPGNVVHSSTSLDLFNKVLVWRNKEVELLETLEKRVATEGACVLFAVAGLVEAVFDAVILMAFTLGSIDNEHVFKRLNNTALDLLVTITAIVYLWRNPLSAYLQELPVRWVAPQAAGVAVANPVILDGDSSDDDI